ncbi:MAG: hypothetical protein ABMA64_18605 [Myxococcota bacterium]
MIVLVLALGCDGGGSSTDDTNAFTTWQSHHDTETVVDTQTVTDTDTETTPGPTTDTAPGTTTLPEGLYGTAPPVNLPVPTFTQVLAMDGTTRSSADLVGHPTVMWFYPAAATGG